MTHSERPSRSDPREREDDLDDDEVEDEELEEDDDAGGRWERSIRSSSPADADDASVRIEKTMSEWRKCADALQSTCRKKSREGWRANARR